MNAQPATKEEFDAFIAAYPGKLERNVAQAYEPPLVTYNDFAGGKVWPQSVVAWHHLGDDNYHITKSA